MIKSIQRKGRKDAKAAKIFYVIASTAHGCAGPNQGKDSRQGAKLAKKARDIVFLASWRLCERMFFKSKAKLLAMTEQRMLSATSTFAFSASLRPLR
jgi:hypothetical protein